MGDKKTRNKTILPASRPSSSYTSIWRYVSLGSRRPHAPFHSLAQHQRRDFPPGWGSRVRVEDIVGEFVPEKSSHESNRGPGIIIKEVEKRVRRSPEASHIMKDEGSKRKHLDRCDDRYDSARERVMTALKLYRSICDELFRDKLVADKESTCIRRVDCHAAKEVKKRLGYVHGAKGFIGDVPGVEVGDSFLYRMELSVVGLHRPTQGGIDYMGSPPNIVATSIVASQDYADDLTNPDQLVYLGQGGKGEDQKLTRGNLALVNSMKKNKPVRVIRKDWDDTFTYDGLYVVDSYRVKSRANENTVFEFLLKRLLGQPDFYQKKKVKVFESSQ